MVREPGDSSGAYRSGMPRLKMAGRVLIFPEKHRFGAKQARRGINRSSSPHNNNMRASK